MADGQRRDLHIAGNPGLRRRPRLQADHDAGVQPRVEWDGRGLRQHFEAGLRRWRGPDRRRGGHAPAPRVAGRLQPSGPALGPQTEITERVARRENTDSMCLEKRGSDHRLYVSRKTGVRPNYSTYSAPES